MGRRNDAAVLNCRLNPYINTYYARLFKIKNAHLFLFQRADFSCFVISFAERVGESPHDTAKLWRVPAQPDASKFHATRCQIFAKPTLKPIFIANRGILSFPQNHASLPAIFLQAHTRTTFLRFGWAAAGFRGTVGFITSMTDHFCTGCNRLRLMAARDTPKAFWVAWLVCRSLKTWTSNLFSFVIASNCRQSAISSRLTGTPFLIKVP